VVTGSVSFVRLWRTLLAGVCVGVLLADVCRWAWRTRMRWSVWKLNPYDGDRRMTDA